jgi:hypothetical protein
MLDDLLRPEVLGEDLVHYGGPVARRECASAVLGRRAGHVLGRDRIRDLVGALAAQDETALERVEVAGRRGCRARPEVAHGLAAGRNHVLEQCIELREGRLLARFREILVPVRDVALPAAGAAPVVEPGADPIGSARHDVGPAVAVDVAGLDRRVVRAVAGPGIVGQGQRSVRGQLGPGLLARVVGPGVEAVLVTGERLGAAISVDVGELDRLPVAAGRRAARAARARLLHGRRRADPAYGAPPNDHLRSRRRRPGRPDARVLLCGAARRADRGIFEIARRWCDL